MGFFEIFMVLIVAIIFLGPDKLPQALIDLAKFFKAVKKTLDDAKTSIDKELNLEELKKEALEYKHTFNQSLEELNQDIKISDEIKSLEEGINQEKNQILTSIDSFPKKHQEEHKASSNQSLLDPISNGLDPQNSTHPVKPKTNFQETSYKDS